MDREKILDEIVRLAGKTVLESPEDEGLSFDMIEEKISDLKAQLLTDNVQAVPEKPGDSCPTCKHSVISYTCMLPSLTPCKWEARSEAKP